MTITHTNTNNITGMEVAELLKRSGFSFRSVGKFQVGNHENKYLDVYYTHSTNCNWLFQNKFESLDPSQHDCYLFVKQNVIVYLCSDVGIEDKLYEFLNNNEYYYKEVFRNLTFNQFYEEMTKLRTLFTLTDLLSLRSPPDTTDVHSKKTE